MNAFLDFSEIPRAEQIVRWQQAIRVLEKLKPHERRRHFDMSAWGKKTQCGTVACAAGHCGLDSWFRKNGFRMDLKPTIRTLRGEYARDTTKSVDLEDYWGPPIKVQYFETVISDPGRFFGEDGAESIFYNNKKRSVAKVLKQMKRYLGKLKRAP